MSIFRFKQTVLTFLCLIIIFGNLSGQSKVLDNDHDGAKGVYMSKELVSPNKHIKVLLIFLEQTGTLDEKLII